MTNKDKILVISIFLNLLFLIILICNHKQIKTVIQEKQIRDTIMQVLPTKPIIIEKTIAKVKYVRDTVIQTQPFIAHLDTVIKYDTIRLGYQFPENYFSLEYRKHPDTLKTEIITRTIEQKPKWWEEPAYFIGGFIIGYIIKK
ncbi:MAG TPA: hypothetical protein PLC04_07075 [Candidatus Kapabacteria bacterium]|mgnify:CR=1 FL=1|jgi:hypothetical protein|nr:hypothetical protein [Candidatus Kapabacteria bacterium]HOV92822.1 hypothetical protein [Candidatus Kapabacteria bacterium]